MACESRAKHLIDITNCFIITAQTPVLREVGENVPIVSLKRQIAIVMEEAFSNHDRREKKIRFTVVTPVYLLPKVSEYLQTAFLACLEEKGPSMNITRLELYSNYYPVSVATTRWEKFVEQCKIIWNIIV
ncbi:MAG: hypothetical protein WCJ59_01930 [bacterium]